jgi:PilZ domain
MHLGMGVPKGFSVLRREPRVPMEVGVQISGHVELPGSEATFTQNISSAGARVFSIRKWKINDRLSFATPTGSFQSLARVAYCEPARESGFAVGLEFLDPRGNWIVARPSGD